MVLFKAYLPTVTPKIDGERPCRAGRLRSRGALRQDGRTREPTGKGPLVETLLTADKTPLDAPGRASGLEFLMNNYLAEGPPTRCGLTLFA